MASSILYILLLLFTLAVDSIESLDECYYLPGHPGKKCYEPDNIRSTCCPLGDGCDNGRCYSIGATPSPKSLSTAESIFLGIGVAVVALVGIIIGAIYWHRRQMKPVQRRPYLLSSFSSSFDPASRTKSSAGVRVRSSLPADATIDLETWTTNAPSNEKTIVK